MGFTLIELLVVILIIGILAAVAIPSFLNQKGKANDAVAKADVRTAQTAMEAFYTDNKSFATDPTGLTGVESTLRNAYGLAVDGDDNSFVVSTRSKGAGAVYYAIVRQSDGTVLRKCGTDAPTVNGTKDDVTGLSQGGGTGSCKSGNTW
jgi:type IV pilus assembly protein PilA